MRAAEAARRRNAEGEPPAPAASPESDATAAAGPASPGGSGRSPRSAGLDTGPSAGPPPLRVSELARRIKLALNDGLPPTVRVRGEVSGLRRATHWYFQLKDDDAVLGCVMFASSAKRAPRDVQDGDEVVAAGRIDFWETGGRTQLYVDTLSLAGDGAWRAKLQKLVERARDAGFLDPTRKRALPLMPRAVAVVTSRTGAALQDVLITMQRRCPAVDVLVVDVRVQGQGAERGIADALHYLNEHHQRLGVDAVVLTRGGGSVEDLWCFNEWPVAEAVARSPVPVVAAIGHETDTTLAELVADERAATPTQAAVRVTPDRDALREQLTQIAARLRNRLAQHLEAERRHLRGLARRPALADPRHTLRPGCQRLGSLDKAVAGALRHRLNRESSRLARLGSRLAQHRPEAVYARRAARLDAAATRLRRAARTAVAKRDHKLLADDLADAVASRLAGDRERLARLERELVLASPRAVLKRGYSLTRRADGSLVRSPRDAAHGERIETVLSDGSVHSIVDAGAAHPARPTAAAPLPMLGRDAVAPKRPTAAKRRKRRRRQHNDDQMDLF